MCSFVLKQFECLELQYWSFRDRNMQRGQFKLKCVGEQCQNCHINFKVLICDILHITISKINYVLCEYILVK